MRGWKCDRNLLRCLLDRPCRLRVSPLSAAPIRMDATAAHRKPKVLVVTGPTAVGKTAVSLALAEQLNGEIISADSVQVYRGLDIGSDKISVADRQGIPHHLLDILDPSDDFSAGDFFWRARAATQDILSRGRTPIVVGGTGFYLRWFILGKPTTPVSTKETEAAAQGALEQRWAAAAQRGPLSEGQRWEVGCGLVEELGDAETAARLRAEANNYYRLRRVVDILRQAPGKTLAQLDLDAAAPSDYDFRCFFLSRPRTELYRRIDSRVEDMVAGGVVAEAAQQLWVGRGLGSNANCATRGIGYRQTLEFLERAAAAAAAAAGEDEGGQQLSAASVVGLASAIQNASRKLCQQQLKWFRGDEKFRWVDATQGTEGTAAEIVRLWGAAEHSSGVDSGGKLTKEEEKEMKRYVPKMEKLVAGSKGVERAVREAKEAVRAKRAAVAFSEQRNAVEASRKRPLDVID